MEGSEYSIEGMVEHIVFHNEENGFTVNGRPVIYAKMYAALASRRNERVIPGKAAISGLKFNTKN